MSINFTSTNVWNHKEIVIKDVFAFIVATNIANYYDLQTLMNIDKGMIDLNGQKQFQQN